MASVLWAGGLGGRAADEGTNRPSTTLTHTSCTHTSERLAKLDHLRLVRACEMGGRWGLAAAWTRPLYPLHHLEGRERTRTE